MEILFEKGIPGFENYRYFNVNILEGIKRFYHIVSKEDSNIGFISISPFDIKKDYEIDLDDAKIIIENGKSGWLVKNTQEVIEKILNSENIKDEAHKRIAGEFTWESSAKKILSIVGE